MKLSTRSRYGVRIMVDLSEHYDEGPIYLKDIAKREDISEKYLSLIVIPLRSAGLIQSTRGVHGGYKLARKPQEITVRSIVEALEGEICLVDCVANPDTCKRVSVCPTRDIWGVLGQRIAETLDAVTLSDLAKKRKKKAQNHLMDGI